MGCGASQPRLAVRPALHRGARERPDRRPRAEQRELDNLGETVRDRDESRTAMRGSLPTKASSGVRGEAKHEARQSCFARNAGLSESPALAEVELRRGQEHREMTRTRPRLQAFLFAAFTWAALARAGEIRSPPSEIPLGDIPRFSDEISARAGCGATPSFGRIARVASSIRNFTQTSARRRAARTLATARRKAPIIGALRQTATAAATAASFRCFFARNVRKRRLCRLRPCGLGRD